MEKLHTEKQANVLPQEDQILVDSKQLASLLGVKEGWIRQNVRKIPHFKMGRLVRFDPGVVMEHFKSG